MAQLDVDSLMFRLLNVGMTGVRLTILVSDAHQTLACAQKRLHVSEQEIQQCCLVARQVFISQSSLIEVEPSLVVCGNIHGQYSDLLRIFDKNGFPPETNYLFLGDYVDRGRQNIEPIYLMFCYRIEYSESSFLPRGNDECPAIIAFMGFTRMQPEMQELTFMEFISTYESSIARIVSNRDGKRAHAECPTFLVGEDPVCNFAMYKLTAKAARLAAGIS